MDPSSWELLTKELLTKIATAGEGATWGFCGAFLILSASYFTKKAGENGVEISAIGLEPWTWSLGKKLLFVLCGAVTAALFHGFDYFRDQPITYVAIGATWQYAVMGLAGLGRGISRGMRKHGRPAAEAALKELLKSLQKDEEKDKEKDKE